MCASFLLPSAWGVDASKPDNAAASLNSVGVALMNQQIPGKALIKFEDAHRADMSSAIPLINKGIALIYLRRLPEAEEALKAASLVDPENPRVWYSLGLALFDSGDQPSALKAFQHAALNHALGKAPLEDWNEEIGEVTPRAPKPTNKPPNSRTSVARNSHIPILLVSNCCSIVVK